MNGENPTACIVNRLKSIFQRVWKGYPIKKALRESKGFAVYRVRELVEANRQKKDIIESVSDCFYALDKDLRFTYMNRAAEEIWGLSRADLLGRKIDDIFIGLIDISLSKFHQVLEEQSAHHFEIYSKVINRWGDMSVHPTRDGISIIFRDTTRRKQAEVALRESEESLRALTLASAGVVYRMNPDWSSMTELYGKGFLADAEKSSVSWLDKYILPNDQEHVTGVINECIREKKMFELEHRVLQSDGSIGWTYSRAVPLLDVNGGIHQWFGAASDITMRKKLEEALRESRVQLEEELEDTKLLHSISTELLREDNILALYEKIIDATACIMHSDFMSLQTFYPERGENGQLKLIINRGFNSQAVKHWEWVDTSGGTSCAFALSTGQRVIVPDINECGFIKGTGDHAIYQQTGIRALQTTPLISRSGKLLGMFSTHWRNPHHPSERDLLKLDVLARQAADLIERKQAEEALQQADKNKNEFLGVLSHELRNPLAAIMMSLTLLDRAVPGGEKSREIMDIMKRQTTQLARLIDDLLDVTRITRNMIQLKKERVELNQLIEAIVNDFKALYEEMAIRLEIDLNPHALFLEADPARLTQIIGNLLHNAVKFTAKGGWVKVAVAKDNEEEQVIIIVQDNGQGIKPEILPQMFQPFMQVDSELDRGQGGLGLGLAIVRGMVELHGGKAEVYSEGLGLGTKFIIRLPFSISQDLGWENMPIINEKASNCLRILVIEDIPDLAEVFCSILNSLGHQAIAAFDGAKGLAKAKEYLPEVIICDIGLPGMNGYEVAERIRQDDELKDIYIIALSGYALPEDLKKATQAGFDRHLSKPVTSDTLKRVLAEAVRTKSNMFK